MYSRKRLIRIERNPPSSGSCYANRDNTGHCGHKKKKRQGLYENGQAGIKNGYNFAEFRFGCAMMTLMISASSKCKYSSCICGIEN